MSPAAQLGDIDLWEHPMEEKKDQGWWRLTQCLTWPDTPHRPHICGFPDCVWVSHTSMPLHVLCPLPGIISSTSKAYRPASSSLSLRAICLKSSAIFLCQ